MTYLESNLRYYMRLRGLKQQETGKAIGIDQSTVNRIVKPDASKKILNPSQRTLQKIADALQCTTDDLLHRDLEKDGRTKLSQDSGLDVRKLAVAMVSVEKAITNLGLRPDGLWGTLAEIVSYAYLKQSQYSGLDTDEGLATYDEHIELKMRAEGYGRQRGDEATLEAGDGKGQVAAAKVKKARGR